jgi:glycosyltransferase involved in cell wall biosynthesis
MKYPNTDFFPKYLSNIQSWHRHVPFAYDLVSIFKPRKIVELGVHYGDSYFTFCQSVKDNNFDCKCFGIDTWKGEKHSGIYGNEVWNIVDGYNGENYFNFSTLIKSTFNSALITFEDSSIDLLHIDGLHTYQAVSEDFYNWLPKVSIGGVILIHDIDERNNGFEVWKLWDEIKFKFKSFEFNFGHGLGVIIKDSDQNFDKHLASLLSNDISNLYYSTKGELIVFKNINKQLNFELSQNSSLLTETQKNLILSVKEKILLEDKVRRMSCSLSWKVTSPFRYLRRKILDPIFRKKPFFDSRMYLELNPDLREIYGNNLSKAEEHYKIHGKKEGRMYSIDNTNYSYEDWIKNFDLITEYKYQNFIKENEDVIRKPLISIIIPVFNVETKIFLETIQTVKEQIYENWELILVDDCSENISLKRALEDTVSSDERIVLITRSFNGHISVASNTGIDSATGDYLVFLDHDDLLRVHSLLRIVQNINKHPECKLIYTDEDKIDLLGKRVSPFFKPDWNPELLLAQNYICHLCCIKTDLVKKASGFREGFEGCQDWDLFLRVTEMIEDHEILHIPEILYHWRKGENSTSSNIASKTYVYDNSINTIKSALKRRKIDGKVELISKPNNYIRVKFPQPEASKQPLVSIIIPTRDYLRFLKKCIEGLLTNTSYKKIEILILDNESKQRKTLSYLSKVEEDNRIKIIRVPGEFNYSRINNIGASHASGELILFLNNDIKPINKDWLKEMVSHGIRKEVGCVGAKLLYQDDTIQHGGVVLGIGGIAGHVFKRFPANHDGYFNRLTLPSNYSAVTAACLLIKTKLFNEVEGFNEKHLKVAFNDVDLCLKVKEKGFNNIWTPFAILYHYESASRGDDLRGEKLKRFNKEAQYMRNKWAKFIAHDPSYNPNLTLYREDFSLGRPRNTRVGN